MPSVAKFYLHDAVSPNGGTLPSGAFVDFNDNDGDAAGARTARDATDVAGTSNPDIESSFTSIANTSVQNWGHRRFVSRPLGAHTFAAADGNWTFSYARSESNLNHNQSVDVNVYAWRPSTGARVGLGEVTIFPGTEPTVAATEQAESITGTWGTTQSILDGDVLIFEVFSSFTQALAVAYTEQFAYDGTTEGSTTTCASFVAPPTALALAPSVAPEQVYSQAVKRSAFFCLGEKWARKGRLWLPSADRPFAFA